MVDKPGTSRTLWEAWVHQAAQQGDLTREEWIVLVNRLAADNSPASHDIRDEIRSFADNELLLLWNASRQIEAVPELHDFIRHEMIRRARDLLAQAT